MPKMISTTTHDFAGRRRKVGDVLEVTPGEARVLRALRRAEDYVEPADKPKRSKKDKTAADEDKTAAAGTYQTRDLAASKE